MYNLFCAYKIWYFEKYLSVFLHPMEVKGHCSITNILQNINFFVQQKKVSHAGLKHEEN